MFEKMTFNEIQESLQKQGFFEVSDGGQYRFALLGEGTAVYTRLGVDWTGTGTTPLQLRLGIVRAYEYTPLYAEDGALICAIPGKEIPSPNGWVWVVCNGELECAPLDTVVI